MPRLDAASISITSTAPPAAISMQLAHTPQGVAVGPLIAIQAARQNARDGGFAGAALAGKDVAVGDAVLRDGVFERGLDVFLVDQSAKDCGRYLRAMTWYMGRDVRKICQAPGDPRHTG